MASIAGKNNTRRHSRSGLRSAWRMRLKAIDMLEPKRGAGAIALALTALALALAGGRGRGLNSFLPNALKLQFTIKPNRTVLKRRVEL